MCVHHNIGTSFCQTLLLFPMSCGHFSEQIRQLHAISKKTMAINEFNGNGLAISSALVGLVVRYSIRSHIVDACAMKKITANLPIEFPFEMHVNRHKAEVKKQH